MKAVMLSIRPDWIEKILTGTKTVEIRKHRPKLHPPFKCYIYCTKSRIAYGSFGVNGKPQECGATVVGEFICKKVSRYSTFGDPENDEITTDEILSRSCIAPDMLRRYELKADYHIGLYAWDISDVVIYDEPKELKVFRNPCAEYAKDNPQCGRCDYYHSMGEYPAECGCDGSKPMIRPPQSWCYVEELTHV